MLRLPYIGAMPQNPGFSLNTRQSRLLAFETQNHGTGTRDLRLTMAQRRPHPFLSPSAYRNHKCDRYF